MAQKVPNFKTRLKAGDPVVVISGGNEKKGRRARDEKGKIIKFLPKKNRVIVEGVNMIKRRKRATSSADSGGVITKEGSVHISNVLYFSEQLQRGVRLKVKTLEDGRKVRGFKHPETGDFEQIDV